MRKGFLRLLWLRFRTGQKLSQIPGFTFAPTEQHSVMTEAEKFKAEHGYSQATDPMPWSDDITQHNRGVEAEYQEEVHRRQEALAKGKYKPRFFRQMPADRVMELRQGSRARVEEVLWDMEMALMPGRRTDVTLDSGVPQQPVPSPEEREKLRLVASLGRMVEEEDKRQYPEVLRKAFGSHGALVQQLDGDEARALQVEQKLLAMAAEFAGEP